MCCVTTTPSLPLWQGVSSESVVAASNSDANPEKVSPAHARRPSLGSATVGGTFPEGDSTASSTARTLNTATSKPLKRDEPAVESHSGLMTPASLKGVAAGSSNATLAMMARELTQQARSARLSKAQVGTRQAATADYNP